MQDNASDMVAKDRQAKGEDNIGAKLTVEKVIAIKRLYAVGATQVDIALVSGISKCQIHRIVNGLHWKHVQEIVS